MKTRYKIILFLLISPAVFGEVLSTSAPPLSFVEPVTFVLLVLLYGCGALLIRELRVRWRLGWGVLLLAVAYGILEEGVIVQSFFNPGWEDLEMLSAYGMFLGVQWPWTLMLIAFHAVISILAPLATADLIWPDYKETPLLKTKGLTLAIAGIGLMSAVSIPGFRRMPNMAQTLPGWGIVIGAAAIVVLLVVFAKRSASISPPISPGRTPRPAGVFAAAFLFQALNVIIPFAFADEGVPAGVTILLQVILLSVALVYAMRKLPFSLATERIRWAAIFGSLGFWMIVATVTELSGAAWPNEYVGSALVSLGICILLLFLGRRIRKRDERTSGDAYGAK
jgi:hypothetical protein